MSDTASDTKNVTFGGRCTREMKEQITRTWKQKGYASETEFWLDLMKADQEQTKSVASDLQRLAALVEPLEELAMNGEAFGKLTGNMQKIADMGEKMETLIAKLEGFEAAASGQKEGIEKLLKTMPAELAKISKAISAVADSAEADRAGYAKDAAERLDEISRSLTALKEAIFGSEEKDFSGIILMVQEIRDHARMARVHAQHWYDHVGKTEYYEAAKEEIAAAKEKTKPPLRVV